MQLFLNDLLPFILPEGYVVNQSVFIRPHEGKSDLRLALGRWVPIIRNWHESAAIIVVHDQDAADCAEVKTTLRQICEERGGCPILIRIACRELENWYLGDLDALYGVYPTFNIAQIRNNTRYRIPDNTYGAAECKRLVPEFNKTEAAQEIMLYMMDRLANNRSESFRQTVSGIQRFLDSEE